MDKDELAKGDPIVFLNSYGVPERDKSLRLLKGEGRDVTPLEWKSEPAPDPVRGTITSEGGTVTVNVHVPRESDRDVTKPRMK